MMCLHNGEQPYKSSDSTPQDTNTLTREQNRNDIGVIISCDLKWRPNIDRLIKKASQRLLIRTLGQEVLIKAKGLAYIHMVRSILEYNSVIWNPTNKEPITAVTRSQTK